MRSGAGGRGGARGRRSFIRVTAAFAAAILCSAAASALAPAAERMLKELGVDPSDAAVRAVAAEAVRTGGGVYTLDALAAKGDAAAVKAFLVTRDFLRAFREDPDIEFPDDETYDIRYLTEAEKRYIARRLMKGSSLKPETAAFLRSAGMDPDSEDVVATHAEGPVASSYDANPVERSLDSLAAEKKKDAIAAFIGTRTFIRRLKKDWDGTGIPKTNYDPVFLTNEERALAGRKFAEGLFKKKYGPK